MSKKMIEVKHLDGTITVESYDKSKKVKHIKRKKNVCDCLDENCPGCFFISCEKCGSKKCGHVCKFYRNFKSCTLEVDGQFENSITHCEFVSDSEDDDTVNINGDVATTSQVENLEKNTDNNEIEKKYLYVENQAVYSVLEKQENENDLLALNDSKNNVKQDDKKDKFIETADDLEKNTNVDELSSQEIKAKKVGKLYTVLRSKEIKNKSFALNDSKNNVKQDDAKYLYENKLIDIGSNNDLVKSEDVNQSDDLTNDNLEKANNVKMLEEIDKGQNDKIKGSIYPSFVDNKKDKFNETADDSEKSINVGNLSSQEMKVDKILTYTLLDTPEHKKELLDLYNGYNNDDSIVKLNNAKSFNETDIKNIEEKYGGDSKTDKLMKMKNNEGKNVDNARKEKKDTEDTSGKINQSVDLIKSDHESFDQTISHKPAKNAETVEFSTNNLIKDKQ